MLFKHPEKPPLLTPQDEQIIKAVLEEEGLPLSSEVILEAFLHMYASVNHNHAWQISNLYKGAWDFRETALAIAETYHNDHKHPEIDNFVHFIRWLAQHLEGIPFMQEEDQHPYTDYRPERRDRWLDGLYTLLENYDREADFIDELHAKSPHFYENVPKGEGGESKVITNNKMYNLVRGGYYTDLAKEARTLVDSPDTTPSQILRFLADNWCEYVTPSCYCNMGDPVAYCIDCVADFPDTPEARKAFRNAVYAIHEPSKIKSE